MGPQQPHVYGETASAFGQDALATGLVFATYAVGLITTAYAQDTIHHLEQTLINARQIGVAIGMLMNAQKLTQDAATAKSATSPPSWP